jgi:hypothetical protein
MVNVATNISSGNGNSDIAYDIKRAFAITSRFNRIVNRKWLAVDTAS